MSLAVGALAGAGASLPARSCVGCASAIVRYDPRGRHVQCARWGTSNDAWCVDHPRHPLHGTGGRQVFA